MTDREKLIELLKVFDESPQKTCPYPEGEPDCENCKYSIGKYLCDILARKADYLIANGVIVPLVKPGDKLFRVVNLLNGENIIVEGIALEYAETFENRKINKRIYFWANGEKFTVRNYSLWLKISEIGETVFSTREEAEKALAERSGNDATH